MPGFLLNASIIFNIALNAYKDSSAGKSGTANPLIAIVFSVVALEAFINEMAEVAALWVNREPEPQKIAAFGQVVKYVEEWHGPLEMKFDLAKLVCTGQLYDKGTRPYPVGACAGLKILL